MFSIPELDETDIQILQILQNEADCPAKYIGDLLNRSEGVIYERIRNLKKKGYINNIVALLNPLRIQKTLIAYIQVKLNEQTPDAITQFKNAVTSFEEVTECYLMAGTYDFNLKIIVTDLLAYNDFFKKLTLTPFLGTAESCFVLNEHKRQTSFKLI